MILCAKSATFSLKYYQVLGYPVSCSKAWHSLYCVQNKLNEWIYCEALFAEIPLESLSYVIFRI